MTINEISKDDFQEYEDVRQSGATNMYAIGTVSELSGLDRDTVMAVMKNYDELSTKYPEVVA